MIPRMVTVHDSVMIIDLAYSSRPEPCAICGEIFLRQDRLMIFPGDPQIAHYACVIRQGTDRVQRSMDRAAASKPGEK